MRIRVLAVGLVSAMAVAVAGCGPKGIALEGNVVIGGKAYNPGTDGDLNVRLASGTKNYSAKVEGDGTFRIPTGEAGGVLPGKYKIGFTRYPTKESMKPGVPPSPVSKELNEEWDVAAGQKFTLDLSKVK